MPAAWWGMAQLYLRHSRSRTHGSTCYEISAKFANEKTPGHCPGFCFDRRNASAYERRVALVMRFALLPKRTSASACVVHLTSQLDQGHHRRATPLRELAFRKIFCGVTPNVEARRCASCDRASGRVVAGQIVPVQHRSVNNTTNIKDRPTRALVSILNGNEHVDEVEQVRERNRAAGSAAKCHQRTCGIRRTAQVSVSTKQVSASWNGVDDLLSEPVDSDTCPYTQLL